MASVSKFHAADLFYSGPTWEVQPVTMDNGEKLVHLWPLADQHPDACQLTPDDAEKLAHALTSAARYARRGGSLMDDFDSFVIKGVRVPNPKKQRR